MGDDNFWADTINLLVVGAILIIMALIMSFNQRNKKMTQSDKAKQWVAENAKAFDCWNRHVEEHGLPLAEFSPLGQESDETILHLTDEQIPRFLKPRRRAKAYRQTSLSRSCLSYSRMISLRTNPTKVR